MNRTFKPLSSPETPLRSQPSSSLARIGRVMVVDDAQWADQATLEVLRYVGRRISATSGLVVVIVRDEDVSREHPLRRVVGSIPPAATVRVRLQPLDIAAVRELAQQSDVEDLFSKTNGNPLLIAELLRSGPKSPPLSRPCARRVQRLSEPARSVVEFASVVPGSCDLDLLRQCVDVDDETLDECERSGLITVAPTEVSFRHELVRMAVERSLGAGRRISLNAAVLAALRSSGVEPARLLHHAVAAGNTDAVVTLTPEAVQRAVARGGYREALEHLAVLDPHLNRLPAQKRAEYSNSGPMRHGQPARSRRHSNTAGPRSRCTENTAIPSHSGAACDNQHRVLEYKEPKQARKSAAEAVSILKATSSVDESFAPLPIRRSSMSCTTTLRKLRRLGRPPKRQLRTWMIFRSDGTCWRSAAGTNLSPTGSRRHLKR